MSYPAWLKSVRLHGDSRRSFDAASDTWCQLSTSCSALNLVYLPSLWLWSSWKTQFVVNLDQWVIYHRLADLHQSDDRLTWFSFKQRERNRWIKWDSSTRISIMKCRNIEWSNMWTAHDEVTLAAKLWTWQSAPVISHDSSHETFTM